MPPDPHPPRYARPLLADLLERLGEPRARIQALVGPRQAGKTTLILQALAEVGAPFHYASADSPTLQSRTWLSQQWEIGRLRAREGDAERGTAGGAILVLDEVQKVTRWSDVVKELWDEDTQAGIELKVVLLGSAPLLIQSGLGETLAGRFEVLRVPHWSFREMRDAFGWDLDRYVFFGGYPGAVDLVHDPERWRGYVVDSLVETTISRDILLLTRVDKPALLRRLFDLACAYSGRILSYQKMLGQLQDAGNTTTLAHYLDLLEGAGMVAGVQKFAGDRVRQRASSPKLQVLNNALMSAQSRLTFEEARADPEFWGHLVESAVGAHLHNGGQGTRLELFYWRHRSREVDFVLRAGRKVAALEVKSATAPRALPGMDAFLRAYPEARSLLIGSGGVPLEEFLLEDPMHWMV